MKPVRQTRLSLAIAKNDREMFEKALQDDSEILAIDFLGRGPLHFAAKEGNLEFLVRLIERRADVNAGDGDGNTPLHVIAGKRERCKVQDFNAGALEVEEADAYWREYETRQERNAEIVRILIEHGADFNRFNNQQETPLSLAKGQENKKIVNLLLSHSALDKREEPTMIRGLVETIRNYFAKRGAGN